MIALWFFYKEEIKLVYLIILNLKAKDLGLNEIDERIPADFYVKSAKRKRYLK